MNATSTVSLLPSRSERFTFSSGGERLIGNLFLPTGKSVGLVVLTGPFTSVKEQAPGAYAEALARRGFAALAFDQRYFGESGGQPRQLENPRARIEDFHHAASALLSDPRFEGLPVFGLGICYGAGPMAQAVFEDPRFRAFAGVAGVYADGAKTKAGMGDAYRPALERAMAAERAWREAGTAVTIPAVGPDGGDVAMPLREAYEYYGTPRGAVPSYVNALAVQSFAYTVPFDVMGTAPRMKTPTLVVHSEKALLPGRAREFYAALPGPKEELWLTSAGQIDFYDDAKLIEPAADAVAAWFRRFARLG